MTERNYTIALIILIVSTMQLLYSQNTMENAITVDSCIQIALLNNYELKVYEQNKTIASKQYSIAQGKLLPTINFSSDYMYSDQFADLQTYNAGNAGIQAYQPIWQNGKIKSSIKHAKTNSEAAEIQFSIDRSNIIFSTTVGYIEVLRNSKINELTKKMVNQFAITVDAARERYELGASKRSDVLKAEAEYSNIQYLAIQVETSGQIATQNLLKVIGFPFESTFRTRDLLPETYYALETTPIDSLIHIADKYLPEEKLIRKQIQQQELAVLMEKKSRSPEIGAFANYSWTDNALYVNEFYGSAGLSLRVNIFSGFQKKNTIAMEQVRLQQMNLQEKEIQQLVIKEIKVAQLEFMEAKEKIGNAQALVQSTKETLDVTNEEYKQGLSSMLELIDAQYTDFEANRNLINAQAAYQLAAAKLRRKTGLLTVQYNN